MSMAKLKSESERLFVELTHFHAKMEDEKHRLENEQDDNVAEREEWDEESDEPEPDEIDNWQEISLLGSQLLNLEDLLSGFEEIVGAFNE